MHVLQLLVSFLVISIQEIQCEPCSAETPEDGWVSAGPELEDYCYMIIDQPRSWQYSKEHCVKHGGDLASIHSGIENGFIQGDYWTGLIKVQPGGQRHWSDGSAYDYTNWGDGEPNDFGGYEDCTSIRKDDGKWNDESCANSHGFVCKKWKNGHEPTNVPPTEIPPGHCHSANGDNKLTEFQGHCYKFIQMEEENGVNWDEGIIHCNEIGEGYKIASIHSERESAFIYTMLAQLSPSLQKTEIWIGANDRDDSSEEGTWKNMDETPFDYTHWASGEPNGSPELDEDCGSLYNLMHPGGDLNGEPGKWNDASCDVKKGVLCKATANSEITEPPKLETCEDEGHGEFYRYNGGCYRWMNEPKSWTEAEADCNQQGGHLVSIWDDLEQAYAFTNVKSAQSWIGLKKEPDQDEYKWSDATYLSYFNWLRHQNMTSSEERCAVLDTDIFDCTDTCEYPDGNWVVTSCTETHPYLCKIKKDDRRYCPDHDGEFDSSWELFQDSCYKLFGVDKDNWQYKEERSFDEARLLCQSKGGDLMSVGSQEENDKILPVIIPQGYMTKSIWIGLQRKNDASGDEYPKDYQWTDGTETDYQHFAESYPNSNGGRDNCIMSDPYNSNYEWINSLCELRRPFVCEVPASANPTTVQPPTLPPDIPCHEDSPEDMWILFPKDQGGSGEDCYNFMEGDYKSWDDANRVCELTGSRLVTIHSEQENMFLSQKLFTQGRWALSWIGLRRDSMTGQFIWADDGTYPDFDAWAPDEPNDFDDMESCTTLIGEAGLWNDESCYNLHSYVCKKPKNGEISTPAPTSIPEGHCSEGFTEFQGYCYQIMGFVGAKDEIPTDWFGAKHGCRDILQAELASIHNSREAAKITTMLLDIPFIDFDDPTTSQVWTGAHEHDEGIWWWSDESKWDYTNWAPGEPDDMDYMEFNCGTVNANVLGREPGTWDDGNCTASFAYVCKLPASPDNPNPPSVPKCDDPNHQDYSKFDVFCYKWINEPKSWSEAEKYCQDHNSHLVSVLDTYEQAYVFTEVQSDAAWLGLNNKENHDLFTWSDGWPNTYINWGHEDNSRNELCAQINVTNDGKWDAVSCDSERPFMCKFGTDAPPTPNPKGQCPYGFKDLVPSSEYCYRIKADSVDADGKSWGDANTQCIAHGASLASIHSNDVQDAIYLDIQAKPLDVWIGLQANSHHQWNWIDYSSYDYNHWNDGEPNSNDDDRYCAYMYKNNGFWDDTTCYGVYKGYVCQIERIVPDVPTTVAPDVPTTTTPSSKGTVLHISTILPMIAFVLVWL